MAIGPHQHRASQSQKQTLPFVRAVKAANLHRPAGLGGHVARRIGPGFALRADDEHELAVEPIQRGVAPSQVEPDVREAPAGLVARLVVAGVPQVPAGAVGHDRAVFVDEAQRLADAVHVVVAVADPEVDAVRVARAHGLVGLDETRGVADAEVGVRLGHRAAFAVVAVQQARRRQALQHEGQFPGQVVGVLDAGIHAVAPVGRETVCGVTHQQHTPLAQPRGHLAAHAPDRPVDDLGIQVRHARQRTRHPHHFVVAAFAVPFVGVAAHRQQRQPLVAAVGVEHGADRVG